MLINILNNQNPNRCIWIEPDDRNIFIADILRETNLVRQRFQSIYRKRVAIRCNYAPNTARCLIALDGFCLEIVLIHSGILDNEANNIIAQFGPDIVLTDNDFLTNQNIKIDNKIPFSTNSEVSTQWIIPTSGTTGIPKLISHDLNSLISTVKPATHSSPKRWGLVYGISRFAGLQVFLQSLLGEGILLFPDITKSITDVITFLVNHECNVLSATPTFWRKILMSPVSSKLNLRQITLGGEIVDQTVLNLLHRNYPAARLTHIYALTEVGVGFSVNDGLAGFPVSWIDTGVNGVRLKIKDKCLWIKTHERALNKSDSSMVEIDDSGFKNTGDQVIIIDNRVYFLGRSNGAINVGGNKVLPEEVEQVLLSYPNVIMAVVKGKKNPFSGQVVTAEVVLSQQITKSQEIENAILVFCRERLEPYKVPAIIKIIDHIDINESCKISRRQK
ncbi:MAG: AMP-binding protein [Legionella sp.]|jgi:acyl-coenzyme A synthetase/AMP-(fatty) acid ligase